MDGRYFVIEGGVVVSIAAADAAYAQAKGWEPAVDGVSEGWMRDGPGEPWRAPEPAPEPVPALCTRRQGQLVLLSHGLLDDAEAAIAAITDPNERRAAQIEYDADTWERSNAFLSQLWVQLGGTPESLDEAFRTAVTL